MANTAVEKGVTLEVLGKCMTNTKPDSQHDAKVEYRHLWSYAQQAALIAVSEKSDKDGCYHLIEDPERRAMRIAAHYADLYFKSEVKSKGELQFYWVALAAFVVKDIVEAYRFARTGVLHREWDWSLSSVMRNSIAADLGSEAFTGDSPYQHVIRTYAALAKGNLWLFMDIHPWLWFFLEYGINPDGTLNKKRLDACLPHRNWETFHSASKEAVEQLPFGPAWIGRLRGRLKGDVVYQKGKAYFNVPPVWSGTGGYGQHQGSAMSAHMHCKANAKTYDAGYRTPPGKYWSQFQQAFYVMEAEHTEMSRIAADAKGLAAVVDCRKLTQTASVKQAYAHLIAGFNASAPAQKTALQQLELVVIAEQEQINVLQPLIYDDPKLKETMDMNHQFSRQTDGWISPKFKVIYSFSGANTDPQLETVFDPPKGIKDRFMGKRHSLPNQAERMVFVGRIAKDFNRLMDTRRAYMEKELRKIHSWMSA